MKLLFIGNSATYVHDIPETLCMLAEKAGYSATAKRITPGGYSLAQHADVSTDHGQAVLEEIGKGYDIVVLQEVSKCISSEELSRQTRQASHVLASAVRNAGAEPVFYVRPPVGTPQGTVTPFEQCVKLDQLFNEIAEREDMRNIYVNRAFAYAMKELDVDLWGPDHAHTSPSGAYLAVCVFFATLFHASATVLDCNELDPKVAHQLQRIADRVAFDGEWNGEEAR